MPSLIPRAPWASRLVYELIYAWPGVRRGATFNVGYVAAPDEADAIADRLSKQIRLYAELFKLVPVPSEGWSDFSVLEVAAGCGGGLAYLKETYGLGKAIGIDASNVAAWRGRQLGVDLRQGDAADLAFADGSFDCLICVDALHYFPQPRFMQEAFRVTKPGGWMLFGECFHGKASAMKERFESLASMAACNFIDVRDATEGARRSLMENAVFGRKIAWLPAFMRDRMKETMSLPGSERFRQWQSGEICFGMALLQRPATR